MRNPGWNAARWVATALSVMLSACTGGVSSRGGGGSPPPLPTYVLLVNSATPSSGVPITVSPADRNHLGNGVTPFTRTYESGITVKLTAPATTGGSSFFEWSGCSVRIGLTCTVAMTSDANVTASYTPAPVASVTGTPEPAAGGREHHQHPRQHHLPARSIAILGLPKA